MKVPACRAHPGGELPLGCLPGTFQMLPLLRGISRSGSLHHPEHDTFLRYIHCLGRRTGNSVQRFPPYHNSSLSDKFLLYNKVPMLYTFHYLAKTGNLSGRHRSAAGCSGCMKGNKCNPQHISCWCCEASRTRWQLLSHFLFSGSRWRGDRSCHPVLHFQAGRGGKH